MLRKWKLRLFVLVLTMASIRYHSTFLALPEHVVRETSLVFRKWKF
jgi:hypothetical protein